MGKLNNKGWNTIWTNVQGNGTRSPDSKKWEKMKAKASKLKKILKTISDLLKLVIMSKWKHQIQKATLFITSKCYLVSLALEQTLDSPEHQHDVHPLGLLKSRL